MARPYRDRTHAGEVLADAVADAAADLRAPFVVLALPRGGVPVAVPVARRLGCPLDVLAVRKIGAPGQPELALGAVAGPDVEFVNRDVAAAFGLGLAELAAAVSRAQAEVAEQAERWRCGQEPAEVAHRVVFVVDDGLATGATMRVAVQAARAMSARQVVACAPVGSVQAVEASREVADLVVCPRVPRRFGAVGLAYEDFTQVPDEAVKTALAGAA